MVAFGLFAVRYLKTSSLDLRQALIPLHMPSWAEVMERFAEPGTKSEAKRLLEEARAGKGRQTALSKDGDRHSDEKSTDGTRSALSGDKQQQTPASPLEASKPEGKNGQPGSNESKPQPDGNREAANRPPQESPLNAQSKDGEGKDAASEKPSSGLMDRMKDALSGLMAKLHPPQQSAQDAARDRSEQGAKPGQETPENTFKNQQDAMNQSGSKDQSRAQAAQGQPAAQAAEKSPSNQSQASDQRTDHKGFGCALGHWAAKWRKIAERGGRA